MAALSHCNDGQLRMILEKFPRLSLAARNTTRSFTVAGSKADVMELSKSVRAMRRKNPGLALKCSPLLTSHAFHSADMGPAASKLERWLHAQWRDKPRPDSLRVPFCSNVTGTWQTIAEARNPAYYATHVRKAVDFSGGLDSIFDRFSGRPLLLLEVGAGAALSGLVRLRLREANSKEEEGALPRIVMSQPHAKDSAAEDDHARRLASVGEMWSCGVEIDFERYWASRGNADGVVCRTKLPTYAFERTACFVGEPFQNTNRGNELIAAATKPESSVKSDGSARALSEPPETTTHVAVTVPTNKETQLQSLKTRFRHLYGTYSTDLGSSASELDDMGFFELKGNSLGATSLLAHITKEFRIRITYQEFLNHSSATACWKLLLSKNIRLIRETHTGTSLTQEEDALPGNVSVCNRTGDMRVPLNKFQSTIFFQELRGDTPGAYNIGFEFALVTKATPEEVRASLTTRLSHALARHPMLRATVAASDGGAGAPALLISRCAPAVKVGMHQCGEDEDTGSVLQALMCKPFDILNDKVLLRVAIVSSTKTNPPAVRICFVIHHMVADGYSCQLLFSALFEPPAPTTSLDRRAIRRATTAACGRYVEYEKTLVHTPDGWSDRVFDIS